MQNGIYVLYSVFAFTENCIFYNAKTRFRSHCGGKEFVASRSAADEESNKAGFYVFTFPQFFYKNFTEALF